MSLFSNPPGGTTGTNQAQPTGGLFGTSTQSQPSTSLFVPSTTTSQPQTMGLFGGATSSQPQQQGGTFSSSFQKPVQSTNTGLFGLSLPIQQIPSGNLFGTSTNTQNKGLFGSIGQGAQQQSQQPATVLQQSTSRIWNEQQTHRQKTVAEQISLIYQKWNPDSPSSSFNTYLYNQVNADAAPFYRPNATENEEKWEEALRKAPNPGAIPILVNGFRQLGQRIINQEISLRVLQGRLHEINNGLSEMLRKHDLEISTRAAECQRRHLRLSQKCLTLATKTQILKNRGYALDGAEEELAMRLKKLERLVLDPALTGRGEEIWARMVNVRERSRWLQSEFERAGRTIEDAKDGTIDDEILKQASKILEDYDKQLTHLSMELKQIQSDFEDWECSKSGVKHQPSGMKRK